MIVCKVKKSASRKLCDVELFIWSMQSQCKGVTRGVIIIAKKASGLGAVTYLVKSVMYIYVAIRPSWHHFYGVAKQSLAK